MEIEGKAHKRSRHTDVPVSGRDRFIRRACLSFTMIDGSMPQYAEYFSRNLFLDIVFNGIPRSIGQVTFMNNPITGVIMFLALLGTFPGRTLLGILGIIVAHLAALFLGFDRKLIRTGFYGYNAFMCAMSLGAFLSFPPPTSWTWFMLFMYLGLVSCFACILQVVVTNLRICDHNLHPMTWAFSFIAMVSTLMAQTFNRFPINEAFVPTIIKSDAVVINNQTISAHDWRWQKIVNPDPLSSRDVILGTLRGVSQVYLNNDEVAGVFILIAMCFCSRISAACHFFGSLVGVGTAQFMGVPQHQILEGIWSYCGALSGLAIGGVFYIFSFRTFVFALFSAAVATFLNAGLASFFSPYGIPTMSFGFIICHTMFTVINHSASALVAVPLDKMGSAEENLRRYKKGLAAATSEDAA